jgi:hypothetical protein
MNKLNEIIWLKLMNENQWNEYNKFNEWMN